MRGHGAGEHHIPERNILYPFFVDVSHLSHHRLESHLFVVIYRLARR